MIKLHFPIICVRRVVVVEMLVVVVVVSSLWDCRGHGVL
jgi:hypothetical protein